MDEFVGFEFVLLDASRGTQKVTVEERGPRRERVDVVARQFYRALTEGDQSDTTPHGLMLTQEFKLRRQVGQTSGWLTFLVDRGVGREEELEEVALVVFAADDDKEGRATLRRLDAYVSLSALPSPPLVVAVRLSASVPAVIEEWFGRSVAGFFAVARPR